MLLIQAINIATCEGFLYLLIESKQFIEVFERYQVIMRSGSLGSSLVHFLILY